METIIKCSNLTTHYGSRKIYADLNFESPQREDFGVAGEKRHRENDHDQYFNGLLETPLGRMPYLRRRHTANAAGDPRAYRPAHREPCAIHVHEYRTDRAILLGFLSEMEQRGYELMLPTEKSRRRNKKISRMSCGQRSQVALGLILAQNADLRSTRRFLDRTRPRLPPTLHRISARIRQSRRKDHLPYLAHHTGHGTAGRRLYHHGLRPHIDSEACKGIARLTFTRYTFKTSSPDKLPHAPSLYSTAAMRDSAGTYSFENEERIKQILQEQSIPYTDFKSEKMNLKTFFHRIDRKILILLSSEL